MFEPRIIVEASDSIWKLLFPKFTMIAPKEMRNPFDPSGKENFKIKPKIQRYSAKINFKLDSFYEAPHLFIYFFDVSNKNDFQKTIEPAINTFNEKNTRLHISRQYIFLDDPKKTGSKKLFSNGDKYIQYLQSQIRDLKIINIKNDGTPKKKDIREIWDDTLDQIKLSLITRVEALKRQALSFYDLRDFQAPINLSTIFEEMSLFRSSIEVMERAKQHIKKELEKECKFISKECYYYPFDLCRDGSEVEKLLADKEITIFDLYFIVYKRQMQCYLSMQQPGSSIQVAWDFLVEVHDRLTSENLEGNLISYLWVCQALLDISSSCGNERAMGRNEKTHVYTSALEWYLKVLPQAFEITKDGIPEGIPKVFNGALNALKNEDAYINEMKKTYETLIQTYTKDLMMRSAAYTEQRLNCFLGQASTTSQAITRVLRLSPAPGLFQEPTEEELSKLAPRDLVGVCSAILSSRGSGMPAAAAALSRLLDKKRDTSMDDALKLPVVLRPKTLEVVAGEVSSLAFTVEAPFEGSVSLYRAKLILADLSGTEEHLRGSHVRIENGSVVELRGSFRHEGDFRPVRFEISSGEIQLKLTLGFCGVCVRSLSPPPPFSVSVELPAYILPATWQHARIVFAVAKPCNLSLHVGGIAVRPGLLRLQSGDEVRAEQRAKEFFYASVPAGKHEMYLPVFAQKSGTLVLMASSNVLEKCVKIPYAVSEFLDIRVVLMAETGVAMLSAATTGGVEMSLSAVSFLDGDGNEVESAATGLPATLSTTTVSALFEVRGQPEVAAVVLQQQGLKPFTLRFNVEHISDTDVDPAPPHAVSTLTAVIPETYSL